MSKRGAGRDHRAALEWPESLAFNQVKNLVAPLLSAILRHIYSEEALHGDFSPSYYISGISF